MNKSDHIRVLIAEDDYLVSEMIKGLLEEIGYVVVGEASNGLEVVEMTQAHQPDVVLMDVEMPDMDGIEATRLIYEHCPTPVVVLTAYETPERVEQASDAGVGAYLIKPPNAREMERAIAVAVARFGDMMKLRHYAGQLEQRVQERTAQLQAQYAQLEAILRSTSDGVVVTDGQGEIILANPVVQAWFSQTLSPQDEAQLRQAIGNLARQLSGEAADGERASTALELTGLDLELKAAPIRQARGEPILEESGGGILQQGLGEPATVVDIHDVTHFKALNRMKTRFITNISHELRTPITTIKLYIALIRQTPQEKWGEYIDALAKEANHQARLIEGILQISRIDAGRLEMKPIPTSLNELTETVVSQHQAIAEEQGVVIECLLAKPEVPIALVDPERMRQVLKNLLGNAILYTPEGGKVTVSIGEAEAEGRTWATVAVADTGMGIPKNELPHVFERFFRGQRPREMQVSGTGLGLAIAKDIVALHGGEITLESEEGVGTTFTVWLPISSVD